MIGIHLQLLDVKAEVRLDLVVPAHVLFDGTEQMPLLVVDAVEALELAIISPKLIGRTADQVSQEFKVDIRAMKDKLVMITESETKGLKSYGKLYEIERRAKALAEAWKRIKEMAKGVGDTKT